MDNIQQLKNKVMERCSEEYVAATKVNMQIGKSPHNMVLKLTKDCNLCCDYCYVGPRNSMHMNKELMLEIISKTDRYFEVPFTINFHGGEPLLMIDHIKLVGEQIEKGVYKNQISLSVQSNGTICTEKVMEVLKRYKVKLGISLDGINDETNSHRHFVDGTSCVNTVKRNLQKFSENGIDLGIIIVVTNSNYKQLLETFQFLSKLTVSEVSLNMLVLNGEAANSREMVPPVEMMLEEYKKIIEYLVETNKQRTEDKRLYERTIKWYVRSLFKNHKGYMCQRSPCGAGINTMVYTSTGDAYICDLFYGDMNFYMGNIQTAPIDELLKAEVVEKTKQRCVGSLHVLLVVLHMLITIMVL